MEEDGRWICPAQIKCSREGCVGGGKETAGESTDVEREDGEGATAARDATKETKEDEEGIGIAQMRVRRVEL